MLCLRCSRRGGYYPTAPRRGRCPHRPADYGLCPFPAVGAAISRPPTTAAPNRKAGTRRRMAERKCFQILMAKGPCGPESGTGSTQILPAGKDQQTKVARPRKQGSRDGDFERPLRVAFIGATLPGAFQGELPQRGKRRWPGPLVPFWASKKEHSFP